MSLLDSLPRRTPKQKELEKKIISRLENAGWQRTPGFHSRAELTRSNENDIKLQFLYHWQTHGFPLKIYSKGGMLPLELEFAPPQQPLEWQEFEKRTDELLDIIIEIQPKISATNYQSCIAKLMKICTVLVRTSEDEDAVPVVL